VNAPLARLIDLVVDDDALVSIAGRRAGIVAIPEPARAIALAALAETSDRRPIVVAVPTSADAERLHTIWPSSSVSNTSTCSPRGRRCRSNA